MSNQEYVKDGEFHRGKTKTVWSVNGHPDLVICENRNDITADDNPDKTRQFAKKAEYATTTTCRVFEFLRDCGIPVAYIKQLSPTEFLAHKSSMVKLEIIGRRMADGSYLKRRPELVLPGGKLYRFHQVVFELFLKTSGQNWNGRELPGDDPFIIDPYASPWRLNWPKKPAWEDQSPFFTVNPAEVLPPDMTIESIEHLLRWVFLALEKGWGIIGNIFGDFKIEIDDHGRVSDVIDSDSWRQKRQGQEMSKQVFRDGGEAVLDEVDKKYGIMAELSARLRVPHQALVVIRASEKDPDFPAVNLPGVNVVPVVRSGHKATSWMLRTLERIFGEYPEGGVIVCQVGRSNGLGPVVAAHSAWPVISTSATYKTAPHDIHSNVNMPSDVPHLYAYPVENAIDAALDILALSNPAVYAQRQLKREVLDESYLSLAE